MAKISIPVHAMLRTKLEKLDAAYRAGKPLATDEEFDLLLEKYGYFADKAGVPPHLRFDYRVGDDRTKGFEQARHSSPMLSLDKVSGSSKYSGLAAWHKKVSKKLGDRAQAGLILEPKVDGISVSLVYRKGALVRAVTRGDGKQGDVITAQVLAAEAAPRNLTRRLDMEVRGELYWPIGAFNAYNKALELQGGEPLANPRNGCAGVMKRHDLKAASRSGIKFVAFHLESCRDQVPYLYDRITQMRDVGLPTFSSLQYCRSASIEAAAAFCRKVEGDRDALGFAADGVVAKVDDTDCWHRLDGTAHHPGWAMAVKFDPERAETALTGVTLQVGRTGRITPVAELRPVVLAGTKVSRASLHNFYEIARKDIRIGDTVVIEKAGEIIPQVVMSLKATRRLKSLTAPTACPACGGVVGVSGKSHFCMNAQCSAQVASRLAHFASKAAMDIDGLGPEIAEQLAEHGVTSPDQLYGLTAQWLKCLPGLGVGSASKLVLAIADSKGRGLTRVLVGLGIRHLGKSLAATLAEKYGDESMLRAKAFAWVKHKRADLLPEGMGVATADAVYGALSSDEVGQVLDELAGHGVVLSESRAASPVAGIEGKTFVVTGELSEPREAMHERLKGAGGRVTGSVSKKTDYLIVGSSPGATKVNKAAEVGVPVLSEEEITAMLSNG